MNKNNSKRVLAARKKNRYKIGMSGFNARKLYLQNVLQRDDFFCVYFCVSEKQSHVFSHAMLLSVLCYVKESRKIQRQPNIQLV